MPLGARTLSRHAQRFDHRPLLVFWETTRACALSCSHCRADAQPGPAPDDLSTDEALGLLDELARMGSPRPICVLTGGDCLTRGDLLTIVGGAADRGVLVALSPSVTPRLTASTMRDAHALGVRTASVSLDGATAATHDAVRGVPGHFESTKNAITLLLDLGYTVQVNTTVMVGNLDELAGVAILLEGLGVDIWEVFFLISTGRGTSTPSTSAQQNEDVCNFLVDASCYHMTVRTVEAPFFRRVALERLADPDGSSMRRRTTERYTRLGKQLRDTLGPPRRPPRTPSAATRDGKGIVFVAANGDVYPSGFLPIRLGSIREEPLVELYREHPLLRSIRRAEFSGTCGTCSYADLCGGSRARALASSGDPLGDDPGCILTNVA